MTKPQVFTSIICLTIMGMTAMFIDFGEVAVGAGAGILALGMKLLEK